MRNPIDSTQRRRIYLLRHAEAAYRSADGQATSNPRQVPLTERGRGEAAEMRGWLESVEFDFGLCSGLPRTRETAGIVLEGRELKLEVDADLEEIHPGGDWSAGVEAIAYAFRDAAEPGARFMGGEVLSEFAARVAAAVELSLRGDWATALFVCHGVTNRAILAWSLQTDLSLFQHIEQDSCCLNVIDVDVDPRDGPDRAPTAALPEPDQLRAREARDRADHDGADGPDVPVDPRGGVDPHPRAIPGPAGGASPADPPVRGRAHGPARPPVGPRPRWRGFPSSG